MVVVVTLLYRLHLTENKENSILGRCYLMKPRDKTGLPGVDDKIGAVFLHSVTRTTGRAGQNLDRSVNKNVSSLLSYMKTIALTITPKGFVHSLTCFIISQCQISRSFLTTGYANQLTSSTSHPTENDTNVDILS